MWDIGRRSTWLTKTSCSATAWWPSVFFGPSTDCAICIIWHTTASPSTRRCCYVNLNNEEDGFLKLLKISLGSPGFAPCPSPFPPAEKNGSQHGRPWGTATVGQDGYIVQYGSMLSRKRLHMRSGIIMRAFEKNLKKLAWLCMRPHPLRHKSRRNLGAPIAHAPFQLHSN